MILEAQKLNGVSFYCGGCKTTALHSIIEKKVNKNSENIKGNTVI